MSIENPTDDLPSCETESCDVGGCREPYAWSAEGFANGPRELRLCERHADYWLAAERDLPAVCEEMDRALETHGRKSA